MFPFLFFLLHVFRWTLHHAGKKRPHKVPKICSKKIAKNYLVEFSNFPNLKLLMINISKFVDSVKIKVLKRQNLSSRCDLTGSLVHSDLSKNQYPKKLKLGKPLQYLIDTIPNNLRLSFCICCFAVFQTCMQTCSCGKNILCSCFRFENIEKK